MPETITLDETNGVTWTLVDTSDPKDVDWFTNEADIGEEAQSLLRLPRKLSHREHLEDGLFVMLAGIDPADPSSGAPPLSLTLVIRGNQVFTAAPGAARGVGDVRKQLAAGGTLASPLELLAAFVVAYHKRMESLINGISEETDELEESVLTSDEAHPIEALDKLRRNIFRIRRYMVAIRNVLGLIAADPTVRTNSDETEALSAANDFVTRHIDSLMDCQERAMLLHDKIESELSHTMAQATYNLTIVATVFLPLTFLTGLLGMNVSGIPEEHDPYGFWVVVGILLAIALVAWKALRSKKGLILG